MLTFLFLRQTSDAPWFMFPLMAYATVFILMIDAGIFLAIMEFLKFLAPSVDHANWAPYQWPGTFGIPDPTWEQ